MRLTRTLFMGTVALILMLGLSAAAAQAASTTVSYLFAGNAFGVSDYFADTSQGILLSYHETEELVWHAGCNASVPGSQPHPGQNFYCRARDPLAIGAVDYQVPGNPANDCHASVSYNQNEPWLIGANLSTPSLLHIPGVSAPLDPSQLRFRVSGNQLSSACSGFYFPEPDPAHKYGIFNRNTRFPAFETLTERWHVNVDKSGKVPSPITFSAALATVTYGSAYTDPLTEFVGSIRDQFNFWIGGLLNGLSSTQQPNVELPADGSLSLTWFEDFAGHAGDGSPRATSRIPIFTVSQRVRAGVPTRVGVRFTAVGRRLITGTGPVPRIGSMITFAPRHGRAVTVHGTYTPQLLPRISSVQFTGSPANPTIAVSGRGLAPLPAQNPAGSPAGHNGCPAETGTTGSDYGPGLRLADLTRNFSAGGSFPAFNETDCIGIVPTQASQSEVNFQLGSFYRDHYPQFTLSPGDTTQIIVNGAAVDVPVRYS